MNKTQQTLDVPSAVKVRRATNHFKSDPISDQILENILNTALLAPSGYNIQPWRFIVVRGEENRKKLMKAAMNQPKVAEAPVVVIACGDTKSWRQDIDRVIEMGLKSGNIPNAEIGGKIKSAATGYLEGTDLNIWATKHTMIAFTTMMLLAESYGIDTAPMEGFYEDKVKEAFGIPEHLRVIALLAMGYSSEPDRPFGGRFPISDLISSEHYGHSWASGGNGQAKVK